MPPSSPLELRLTPGNRPGLYTVSYPGGSHETELRPDMDVGLGELLRRVQPVLVGGRDPAGQMTPSELLRALGIRLWQALLPATASEEARQALATSLRRGTSPIWLDLPKALASLPWELLCDPDAPEGGGFLAQQRPIARLVESDGPELAPVAPPLRVLVLISAPPEHREVRRVDVESERAAIEEATREAREQGLLHLLVEDIVTSTRVRELLLRFKPHLLHYIGHGGYAKSIGGFLEWEDERGRPTLMSSATLVNLLRPRGLRAVLLHGCDTAKSEATSDFGSVATALIEAGIPAVLAQQAKLTYESSQRSSRMFYQALTWGQGLAEALGEARQSLADSERPDWAAPQLQGTRAGLASLLDESAIPGPVDPTLERHGAAAELPAPTGVFVGRQRELRALREMLESPSGRGAVLALITGPGGVGKSTLAAQAVVRYGDRYKAGLTLSCQDYQDIGLFFQQIGEFLKRQGAPDFLEGILLDPKLSVAAKSAEAVAALNQAGPFLIIVDNLESVQDDERALRDEELCHLLRLFVTNLLGGRILVTGRYAVAGLLPDGKFQANLRHLDLDDLSGYEIHQLLARHPALARLGENMAEILVEEFGGLPYVYDLLSSQAASLHLEAIIRDVQGRVTKTKRERSAAEWNEIRQQVVEFATLESTVIRLPEEARTLLARLSVLRRPFPLEALEQGLEVSKEVWKPLVDWALLRLDPVEKTYRLHSLTTGYAGMLLAAEEKQATQLQLATWYEHHAASTSHELADYLEAHRLLSAAGAAEQAARLANTLGEVLSRAGLYSLWRSLCLETLSATQGTAHASALHQLGIIAQLQGDYPQAHHYYQESLAIKERLGDQRGRANTLHQLGVIAQHQGDYLNALQDFHNAISIFERLGDQRGRAKTLGHLGIIAQHQGDYPKALQHFHEVLDLTDQLGDRHGHANALHQLGMIAQLQSDYPQALQHFHDALALTDQLGDQHGRAATLHQLGVMAQHQGDYPQALQYFQAALATFERLGDQRGRANTLHQLGMMAQHQGDYPQALQYFQAALATFERLGDQRGRANTLHQLGIMAQHQGDYPQALQYFHEGLALSEHLSDWHGHANALHQLGIIAQLQSDYPQALQRFQESLATFERLGDQRGCAATLHQLGMMAQEQGDYPKALQRFCDALVILEHLGDQRGRAIVLGQLGQLARAQEDYRSALLYVVQSLTTFEALRSPQRILALRVIAELRAEMGEEAFANMWEEVVPGQPMPAPATTVTTPQDLLQRLITFIQARTWNETEQLLAAQPDMLSPEADALLLQLAAVQEQEDARQLIEQHRAILARCREIGIAETFVVIKAQADQARGESSPDASEGVEEGIYRLLCDVHTLLIQGSPPQRQALAEQISGLQMQLPPDDTTLVTFLGCLVALLRGEAVDASILESPFDSLWQQLQDALTSSTSTPPEDPHA